MIAWSSLRGKPSRIKPLSMSVSLTFLARIAQTTPSFNRLPFCIPSNIDLRIGESVWLLSLLISSPTIKLGIPRSLANLNNQYMPPKVPLPDPGAPIMMILLSIIKIN